MYPFVRTATKVLAARRLPPLPFEGTDSLTLRILPWDLDGFFELNNGRILTLFDIGRFTLAMRTGLLQKQRENRWAFAVAGSFVRYRKRMTLWDKVELRTRVVGRDGRFVIMEQAMWRGETCTVSALIRAAVTSKHGVVDPGDVLEAMGQPRHAFAELPIWVCDMMEAETERPWPPQF